MNKQSWLMITAICTFAGSGVAAAHAGGKGHLFERLDTNKDGVITSQEAEASALAHFAELDTNKDGKLTPEERKAVHEKRMSERFEERDANDNGLLERSELSRMPEAKFVKLDTDKSGALSAEELSSFGPGHGCEHKGMGTHADTDGDGALSKAEFLAKAKKRMERLDANSDGKVTQDELKAMRGRGHGHGFGHGPGFGPGHDPRRNAQSK